MIGDRANKLTLRPSRLPLLWLLPLMAFVLAIAILEVSVFVPHMVGYGLLLLVLLPRGIAHAIFLVRGRTVADTTGLHNRIFRQVTTIPWSDVDYLKVRPTLFGRVVTGNVRRNSRSARKTVGLAAPRSGLLASAPRFESTLEKLRQVCAQQRGETVPILHTSANPARIIYSLLLGLLLVVFLLVDKPWLDPWWHNEAIGAPQECPQSGPITSRLNLTQHLHDSLDSTCFSESRDSRLRISYKLQQRDAGASGTKKAHESFPSAARTFLGQNSKVESELGDEALSTTTASGSTTRIQIIARHNNIITEITYSAPGPSQQILADSRAVTQEAIGEIRLV